MVVVRWADVCLISLRWEMLGGWGGVLMLVLWCGSGWCGLGGRQWAVEVIWTCPIIYCTPSDPIFPKVPSHYFPYPFWSHISQSALLNAYTLMVLCWGHCSLLSMGWVSLSSKEMPLTCLAGCSRRSVRCGWVHDAQGFPLSGNYVEVITSGHQCQLNGSRWLSRVCIKAL